MVSRELQPDIAGIELQLQSWVRWHVTTQCRSLFGTSAAILPAWYATVDNDGDGIRTVHDTTAMPVPLLLTAHLNVTRNAFASQHRKESCAASSAPQIEPSAKVTQLQQPQTP
jgi:hypothetical protein